MSRDEMHAVLLHIFAWLDCIESIIARIDREVKQ